MPTIKERIQQLPNWVEVLIVFTLGFGLFIYTSTQMYLALLSNPNTTFSQPIEDSGMVSLVIYELISLGIITLFLYARNWKLEHLNFNFSYTSLVKAIGLLFVKLMAVGVVFTIYNALMLSLGKSPEPQIKFDHQVNLYAILLVVIFNSIYEEVLLIGYIFKRFEKINVVHIVAISAFIRVSMHTYQGTHGIIALLIMGVIFASFFAIFKNLSALIITHGLHNSLVYLAAFAA